MYSLYQNSGSSSFSDTDIDALKQWTDDERRNICLTFFIDSQNLQIALCPLNQTKKAIYIPPKPVNCANDVKSNYESLRTTFARNNCIVVYSTMSFAGPITQDYVVITNWQCDAKDRVIHFTSLPFDLFPLDRRRFMNDLEAASYGLLAKSMRANSLESIFQPFWETKSEISLNDTSCVILIGDGFGVSYICRNDSTSSEQNCVVSSEAGHSQCYICGFNDPNYKNERDLIKFISDKLYCGSHQPEWEDMCSFRGAELIFEFLKKQQNIDCDTNVYKYNKIRELAINGERDALEAFKIHYKFIMRAAQVMCLGVRSKRVFIISDAQVKNSVLIRYFSDELKSTFCDHPRSEWFQNITVYGQVVSSQFGLSGGLFLSNIFAATVKEFSHNM